MKLNNAIETNSNKLEIITVLYNQYQGLKKGKSWLWENITRKIYPKSHDEGFSDHAIKSFPFILKGIRKFHKGGLIVDLGCGSGITAERLVENNYLVLGIDYSSSMIRLARIRAPNARFLVGSVYNQEIPKCSGVLSIGEVFNYNFDRITNFRLLGRIFVKILKALIMNQVWMQK